MIGGAYFNIGIKVLDGNQEFHNGQPIVSNSPVDREAFVVIFAKSRLGIGLDAWSIYL